MDLLEALWKNLLLGDLHSNKTLCCKTTAHWNWYSRNKCPQFVQAKTFLCKVWCGLFYRCSCHGCTNVNPLYLGKPFIYLFIFNCFNWYEWVIGSLIGPGKKHTRKLRVRGPWGKRSYILVFIGQQQLRNWWMNIMR